MRWRFGDVVFDVNRRELSRNGRPIEARNKVLELMQLLLEHRHKALSKSDLQQMLWPRTFVTEGNLASLVKELRELLDDDAHESRYIDTLHGFGYRFVADVTVELGAAATSVYWLATADAQISLVAGENVIGRGSGVGLDAATVSKRHARIIVAADAVTIEDLESKNGTFVNNVAVTTPRLLQDGDRIRVGSYLLTFREGPRHAATTTQTT